MQSYEQFKSQMLECFSAAYPDAEITMHSVTKNNGVVLDGITVLEPGSNLSPNLYLNPVYEDYLRTGSFTAAWHYLRSLYEENRTACSFDMDRFLDFDRVRDHLYCRLISAARNAALLQEIPYEPYLDLAIVYYYGICSDGTCASVLVRNSYLDDWQISKEALQEIALRNTRRQYPSRLISLSRFLTEENSIFRDDDDALPLYILTNQAKLFGASALLDTELLRSFADEAGDFYILPSSLHEVLLISKAFAPAPDTLNEIIRDVNRNHLNPEDILSDHLYTYSVQTQSVE